MTFAIATTLVGCSAQNTHPNITTTYTPSEESRDGVVVGSISYAGHFSGYSVYYRSIKNGKGGSFQIGQSLALFPNSPESDFDDPDSVGALFAVTMPEGDYEVFLWSVGSGVANVSPTVPFSIPFTVEAGKLLYLGSFQFTQTAHKGLTVTGATLALKDAALRDLSVMRRKFPNLAEIPVRSAVATDTDMMEVGGKSDVRFTTPVPILLPGRL